GEITWYHRCVFTATTLCKLYSLPAPLQKDVDMLLLTRRQGIRSIPAFIQYKHTHRHAQLGQQTTYLLLFIHRAAGKTVVFYASESVVVCKLNLIKDILSGMVLKLSLVGAVVMIKRPCLLLLRLCVRKGGRQTASDYGSRREERSSYKLTSLHVC